jgi:hypothetical protein
MKLANATINDVQHDWQKLFAAALQKRVGDKVKVEIYPASQLGAIPRMVDGVLLGTIESFITPTSFLVPTDPRFQIYDVPGLFASLAHVHAVIHDPAYRDHVETMFVNRGLRIIGAIYNSPTVVLTKKPAPTLEGLKGLEIRTFASPLQMEPMKAVGAIPVPLALTEVIPQLQSGGIDGMLAGMPRSTGSPSCSSPTCTCSSRWITPCCTSRTGRASTIRASTTRPSAVPARRSTACSSTRSPGSRPRGVSALHVRLFAAGEEERLSELPVRLPRGHPGVRAQGRSPTWSSTTWCRSG